ncbi:Glycosylphosphatidylinositol (GPI) anchor assembly protein [Elasticomyces elasticus]|nr:Glycosylphosphatidylinositol (GPI) anchor assembly protein [Elasticomyces elasticus]KAK3652663.1 Glycosylphosphatidylinositol (GPI) anchor assembly protein [Elasticomyces elasticus]KAK4914593.1 Glycosylphosphatidylinositol (GPI) anchor assembly protein [Elasticomyces elasticus]KAK5753959.1 Glycosylphosphatidylinositol (GPI) anchor assembly protein [Elasticomyces elasticus]
MSRIGAALIGAMLQASKNTQEWSSLASSVTISERQSKADMKDISFLGLPPELRLRIYEHALRFESTLQRPVRPNAWCVFDGYVANVALLSTSKLIHKEAKDAFYEVNKFNVSYNTICYCENQYPYPPLEQRLGVVRVTNFFPRIEEAQICNFCYASGYGLLEHLIDMPKLRRASIVFEDIFNFADYTPELLQELATEHTTDLSSNEVGTVQVLGLKIQLSLELPALQGAWSALARGEKARHARHGVPAENTMRRALEYLRFEANTYDRTAVTLLPFFVADNAQETRVLRTGGIATDSKMRADFTIALAGVMNDIFADEGGSDSVTWAEIEGKKECRRWEFCEKTKAERQARIEGFIYEDDD